MVAVHAEVDRTRNFAALAEAVDFVRADVWGLAAYIAKHIGAKWGSAEIMEAIAA
ncbi:MAG: hypothetical protein ABWY92_02155 [Xanthobacteraceae bacterium]